MNRSNRDQTAEGAAAGGALSASGDGTRRRQSTLHRQLTWRDLASEANLPTPEERQIMEELDREIASTGGLVALVVCLMVAAALLTAGMMGIFG